MQSFNLLDRSLLPPPPDWLALGGLVLAALGAAATTGHAWFEQRQLAALLATPAQAEAEATGQDDALQRLATQLARHQALHSSVQAAGSGLVLPGAQLQDVTSALGPDMWLEEIELGPGDAMKLRGRSLSTASLAPFVDQLRQGRSAPARPVQTVVVEPAEQAGESGAAPPQGNGSTGPRSLRFVIGSGAESREPGS